MPTVLMTSSSAHRSHGPTGALLPGARTSYSELPILPACRTSPYLNQVARVCSISSTYGSGGYESTVQSSEMRRIFRCDDLGQRRSPGDVIVGAPFASMSGKSSGSVYVLSAAALGSVSPGSVIQLGNLGDTGFRVDGSAAGDLAGYAVAGAPDLNSDGVPDLIVGAPGASPNGANSGSAFALFDRAPGDVVSLAQLTAADGVRFNGAAAGDKAGRAVAAFPASDPVGTPSVVVGAPLANSSTGVVYVLPVVPTSQSIELSTASDLGIQATGAAPGDEAGFSVSAGRVAGAAGTSRLLLIGAPGADPGGRSNAGAVIGLDLEHTSGALSLAAIPASQGFSLTGSAPGDEVGFAVAPSQVPQAVATPGEVAIVGAPNAALEANPLAGVAFLAGAPVIATAVAQSSGSPIPRHGAHDSRRRRNRPADPHPLRESHGATRSSPPRRDALLQSTSSSHHLRRLWRGALHRNGPRILRCERGLARPGAGTPDQGCTHSALEGAAR